MYRLVDKSGTALLARIYVDPCLWTKIQVDRQLQPLVFGDGCINDADVRTQRQILRLPRLLFNASKLL